MKVIKVISTAANNIKQRVVTFLGYGRNGNLTGIDAPPFGIESHAPKDTIAIYSETSANGSRVVLGYLNTHALTKVGETRLFSTNDKNEIQIAFHLKNDGTAELGGNADFLARFNELKTGFDQLVADHNALVTAFNTHVHPGVTTGNASTLVTATPETTSTASIDAAKIDELKTS